MTDQVDREFDMLDNTDSLDHWDYRVVKSYEYLEIEGDSEYPEKDPTPVYSIREVYYDKEGLIQFWSAEQCGPYGTSFEEFYEDMGNMWDALDKPILNEEELMEQYETKNRS